MNNPGTYDVGVIGGGLAGLAFAIQLSRAGYSVVLFEKETYPFHRVCGEYISMESWDFITSLGIDLPALQVSRIERLQVSSVNGRLLEQALPLGGFGISRYRLDHEMAKIAKQSGVRVEENCKVNDIVFREDRFQIETQGSVVNAKLVAGAFGKRSNIDIKHKRPFAMAAKNKLNNYIGVKYHVRIPFPGNIIALHNFANGYCGVVKIEGDTCNLCYLTTAANLHQSKGSITVMEQTILAKNPHLKEIFSKAGSIFETPVVISQISFDKKSQVEDHMLMLGDAAGMITPLCGNGMSMALHASKIAAEQASLFLQGKISRVNLEKEYTLKWRKEFSARLRTGRRIQRLFGSNRLVNLLIGLGKRFPDITRSIIRKTHGKPF